MCLNNLVKAEGFADLDVPGARCDLLDQISERRPYEIFQFTGVGCKADRSRDRLHWSEIVEGPFVTDNAGHGNDAALFGAPQRIFQPCRAHEFEDFVDPVRVANLSAMPTTTDAGQLIRPLARSLRRQRAPNLYD
jgi:hypothetical protein